MLRGALLLSLVVFGSATTAPASEFAFASVPTIPHTKRPKVVLKEKEFRAPQKPVVLKLNDNSEAGFQSVLDTGSSFWKTIWEMPVLTRLMLALFCMAVVFGRLQALRARELREMSNPMAVLERSLGSSTLLENELAQEADLGQTPKKTATK